MAEVDASKYKIVTLAGKTFAVKRVPMARIKRLELVVSESVSELRAEVDLKKLAEDPDAAKGLVGNVMDKLLGFPHAILSIFIDDLPLEIFLDEENGVDLPDFLDALHAALTLNRTDVLKNVFSRLIKTLIETRAQTRTISQRTN